MGGLNAGTNGVMSLVDSVAGSGSEVSWMRTAREDQVPRGAPFNIFFHFNQHDMSKTILVMVIHNLKCKGTLTLIKIKLLT